jgi:DNA-binding response OmpR family regulator
MQLMGINAQSSPAAGAKMSVLVVDDDARILKFIAASLKLSGYEVISAVNGEDALRLIASKKIDIIVLDMLMPLVSGFDVLKHLQAVSSIPVLAVSAHASASEKALNLGARDFLAKPFMPDELIKRIKALTNHKA